MSGKKGSGNIFIGCFLLLLMLYVVVSMCVGTGAAVLAGVDMKGGDVGGQGAASPVVCTQKLKATPVSCSSGKYGIAVAQAAALIARHLYGVPDTFYDAAMPGAVLSYWNSVCPDGSDCRIDWQQGNVQCVFLVTGAFALAGHPLPIAENAIQFWGDYAGRSGFEEIPAGAGMPEVGDIIVWDDSAIGGVGHVAIVTTVLLPQHGQNGIMQFVQANSLSNSAQATIAPDSSVQNSPVWPGYHILGFIRTV